MRPRGSWRPGHFGPRDDFPTLRGAGTLAVCFLQFSVPGPADCAKRFNDNHKQPQFAGPLGQRSTNPCGLFFNHSNTARARPPQGPRAPKIGAPNERQPHANHASTERRTYEISLGEFSGRRRRGSNTQACVKSMARWPTVVRTRFRRPPGSILGPILASKMIMFISLFFGGPVGAFLHLFSVGFLQPKPSTI